MINTWWLICNSKEMSHPNPLGNAVRVGDGKTDFLEALADCDSCKSLLIASSMDLAENHYLNLLSRGGLMCKIG